MQRYVERRATSEGLIAKGNQSRSATVQFKSRFELHAVAEKDPVRRRISIRN
jgi:hypothetical protein